jgi:hypothetical protein
MSVQHSPNVTLEHLRSQVEQLVIKEVNQRPSFALITNPSIVSIR